MTVTKKREGRKAASGEKKAGKPAKKIEPVTLTCKEAARRHPGLPPIYFRRLCLHGKWCLSRYDRIEDVPGRERKKAIFAKKVGKYWQIPEDELDRIFREK